MPPSLRSRLRSSTRLFLSVVIQQRQSLTAVLARSASNRTGLLAATDSMTAFIPLRDIVSEDRLQELLAIFDKEANVTGLSALQRRQYEIQREWFANGDVPAVELILWSKGLLNLQEGESYAVMLGGLMVSRCVAFH